MNTHVRPLAETHQCTDEFKGVGTPGYKGEQGVAQGDEWSLGEFEEKS